ncbi:GFA family protein [Mesorhizobium sp. ORM6]
MELSRGCLSGEVRFQTGSEPRVHYCHCDMCRRAMGSAFAVLAWVPSPSPICTAATPTYRRSSPNRRKGFCSPAARRLAYL